MQTKQELNKSKLTARPEESGEAKHTWGRTGRGRERGAWWLAAYIGPLMGRKQSRQARGRGVWRRWGNWKWRAIEQRQWAGPHVIHIV